MKMNFRHDINGLRAIAVVGVVLYHFFPAIIPGGFAGVDVFFVISGYLMTRVILSSTINNEFSFVRFYMARVNRIVPALLVLCISMIVFGYFYINANDYAILAKHIASSALFLSNFVYFGESGYFDASSLDKWLLHTWSLSAEWQFYLIYPLVIWLSRFMNEVYFKCFTVLLTLFSFALCISVGHSNPSANYYLLPFRAWEMLMGGLIIIFNIRMPKKYGSYVCFVGLVLVVLSYFIFSKETMWPGYYSLVPVIGTCFVIASNFKSSNVFKNVTVSNLGLWSYSIYLWHWPFVVFISSFSLGGEYKFIGLMLSLLVGALSFKYIESSNFLKSKNKIWTHPSLILIVFIFLVCVYVYIAKGIPDRTKDLTSTNINEKYSRLYAGDVVNIKYDECQLHNSNGNYLKGCDKLKSKKSDVKAIILGDSHAGSVASGIQHSFIKSGIEGEIINARASGCLPLITDIKHRPGSIYHGCGAYNQSNLDYIEENYPKTTLIIAARFNIYFSGFNEWGESNNPFIRFSDDSISNESLFDSFAKNICQLSTRHKIYIVKPLPEFDYDVYRKLVSSEMMYGSPKEYFWPLDSYHARNSINLDFFNKISSKCEVHILDFDDYLLTNDGYKSTENNIPIYQGSNHLNIYGSVLWRCCLNE